MGVGIFLFPRLLGGEFGENVTFRRMALAAVALLASFAVEIWVNPAAGQILRAAAFIFALAHVPWRRGKDAPPPGTLANALRFCACRSR